MCHFAIIFMIIDFTPVVCGLLIKNVYMGCFWIVITPLLVKLEFSNCDVIVYIWRSFLTILICIKKGINEGISTSAFLEISNWTDHTFFCSFILFVLLVWKERKKKPIVSVYFSYGRWATEKKRTKNKDFTGKKPTPLAKFSYITDRMHVHKLHFYSNWLLHFLINNGERIYIHRSTDSKVGTRRCSQSDHSNSKWY